MTSNSPAWGRIGGVVWYESARMTMDQVIALLVGEKEEKIVKALDTVGTELRRAMTKHTTPFHSHHEGYAVILEELDEYKAEVFKGGSTPHDPQALKTELVQTAAMAVRALVDLCL